ncbi:serine protease [Alloyangia pacifica]|uniref:Putative peptidoglycan binding domain-containing protein n=1 Tax=Alloyangia pacifica TaxID=311180 RepID=A0A1I6VX42_9RHOB|nr:serine protease [Alloyangia pacifica]SDI21020.1 Putative peptidoglycan binding domain-containing protein [Alloyangia pacifica]SFT18277.1 Putative peptidoglycan binding domain-containing protein [Alloyangia pacifica]
MFRSILFAGATAALLAHGAAAQQGDLVYIQIEAQPSLNEAEARLRDYAGGLQDVNGFSLGGGWYGIALGPYAPEAAAEQLRSLRAAGRIPRDSYLAASGEYGRQFWPVGAGVAGTPSQPPVTSAPLESAPEEQTAALADALAEDLAEAPDAGAPVATPDAPVAAEPAPEPEIPEETVSQARRSEQLLNAAERQQLQVALRWSGHYDSAIDGAFGNGTRMAMGAWQRDNGYQVTGILTTRQRADLLGKYNAVLEGTGMQEVTDARAGIAIEMPMGVLDFDRHEAPFAIYSGNGELEGAQALLISQPGDRKALGGLYEILQTLAVVPVNGARSLRRDGFTLTGSNASITSHTEVQLRDGQIKGWTLVWPAGDEARFERVVNMMKTSFRATAGVLDPASVSDDGQSLDLVSGLPIRKPRETVAGFFVDGRGTVLTTAEAVAGCSRLTLDGSYDAQLLQSDADLGVALLRPTAALAPRGVARLRTDMPRLNSEVAVAGFPYGGVLSAPTLTFGALADSQGLGGEETLARLEVETTPGDAGGPVLDTGGAVVGVLMPRDAGAKQLPEDVAFATDASALLAFLQGAGISGNASQGEGVMAPEDLTAAARDMTVAVNCWE